MKFKYQVAIVAATLLILASLSYAGGPLTSPTWPTQPVHDFDCSNCHSPTADLASLTANLCLNCHGAGKTAGFGLPLLKSGPGTHNNPTTNFAAGDASDAMGSVSALNPIIVGDQTSHNWGANETNPAAGARRPTNPLFSGDQAQRNYSGPLVSCSRCHNPHGWKIDYLPRYVGNPKLLKLGPGSEVVMCNDCHRDWAAGIALSEPGGSASVNIHPMVTDYAAIAAAKSGQYNNVAALNAAPGEITLNATGGIDCLSCHGVHFTDSDASTTDGVVAGSVAHLNPGGTSRGKILKADGPGISGSNLCQTCHKYIEHGIDRGNPIGCLSCHGAHIPDSGGALNNYMLRAAVTTKDPNHAGDKTSSGLTFSLADAQTSGQRLWNYCFNCHDSAVIAVAHDPNWNCVDCHSHDVAGGSWAAAGGCNTCHGYPPSEAAAANGSNNGYAVQSDATNYLADSGHYKPENTTLHSLHATTYNFTCTACHAGHGHIDQSYDDVFLATSNQIYNGAGRLTGGNAPTYNSAGSGTCSSVYCHSNGGPRGGTPLASPPVTWTAYTPITTCAVCHGNDVASMSSRSNSPVHSAHLNKGYSCQVCHADTATSASALSASAIGGTHVNGSADVVFDDSMLNPALGLTSYGTSGSCSIYCHSNGSVNVAPDWDDAATGACGTCHQYSVANVATGSGSALGGAHAVHLYAANGPKIATCTTCHGHNGAAGAANSDHVNGSKDLVAGACDTCHGSGAPFTGNDRAPIWTDATSVDCKTCHSGSFIAVIGGNTASAKISYDSFGHGKLTPAKLCNDCHDATAAGHFDGDQLDKRLKNDPAVDGGAEVFTVSNNLWCQDCHAGMQPHFTTGGGSTDGSACLTCHDPHGQSQDAMIADLIGGKPVSGFVTKGTAGSYFTGAANGVSQYEGICQVCHDSAAVNYYTLTAAPTAHNAGAVCVSCHPHTTTPAFKASCNGCHGDVGTGQYWPFGSGGSIPTANDQVGEHAAHVLAIGQRLGYGDYNSTMYTDVQQKTICEYCHAALSNDTDHGLVGGLDADVFVAAGGGRHAKSLWDVADTDAVYNAGPDTCSNVDCHNNQETLDGSYGWYDAGTSACLLCHNDMTNIALPTGETHVVHTNAATTYGVTINCASCHDATTNWSTNAKPANNHIDGILNMGGTVSLTYSGTLPTASSFGSCAINACHNDGKGGASVEQLGDGYIWGTAEASACGICHAAVPTSDDHTVHLSGVYGPAIGTDCSACHQANANNSTMAARTTHINNSVSFANVAVPATPYEVTSGQIGLDANDGIDSCDLCHGGNTAANLAKDEWTTANRVSCESCHGDSTVAVIGGISAPNRAGTNYDSVGHGRSGAGKPNRACVDCHAEASAHISGVANDANRLDTIGGFDYAVSGQRNNFCNVCHTTVGAMPAHFASTGGSTSGLYCVSCHDPHGQSGFDAMVDATVGGTLVAEGTRTVTGFAARAVRGDYSNPGAAFDGICQTCHTADVNYFNQSTDSDGSHNSGSNCISCHLHNADTAFVASCNACHGDTTTGQYWPDGDTGTQINAANQAGRHNIHITALAARVYSESIAVLLTNNGNGTSDVKQKALCEYCHAATSNDSDHGLEANLPAEAFVDADMARHAKSYWGAVDADASYNAAADTCSTTDCHNNKTTADGTYGWYDAGTSACIMCHDNITIDNTDTHYSHLNAAGTYGITSIACADCHQAATLWGTAPASGHWDGAWTIQGSNIAAYTNGSWATSTKGTCGTNDCHNDGKGVQPAHNSYTWGQELSSCGLCHAATPTTDAHNGHFTAVYGPQLAGSSSCSGCHQANANNTSMALKPTHINGTITFKQVDASSREVNSGEIGIAGNDSINSCDACHGGNSDANTAKDLWSTVSARVTCESCHVTAGTLAIIGGPAPAKDAFVSAGHGIVTLGTPADRTCQSCHDENAAGHFGVDGDRRLQGSPKGVSSGNDFATDSTLWCQECHTTMNAHYHNDNTPGNNSTSGNSCVICHEPHGEGMGTNTDAMLIVGANFTDRGVAASYFSGSNNGVCQICHDSAEVNHYSNNAASDGHNAATACVSCHAHTTAPAFQGGECFDCHGDGVAAYWPQAASHITVNADVKTDYNDDGRHSRHLTVLAAKVYGEDLLTLLVDNVNGTSDTKQRTLCSYCHDLADSDHASTGGPADVFRGNLAKQYWQTATDPAADTDATYNAGADTCANIDCHNNQLTTDGSYGWYDAVLSACILCHADVSAIATATGTTHTRHTGAATAYGVTINCASCHDDATVWSTTPGAGTAPAAGHWNGSWDIDSNGGTGYAGSWNTAPGTCGTNNCHEDGKGGVPVVIGYTWGTAEASACGICHADNMATAAHDEHLSNSHFVSACTSCHTAATAATHIDNSATFGTPISSFTSGTGTCTNSCHTVVDGRDWTSATTLNCNDCHGAAKSLGVAAGGSAFNGSNIPTTGRHAKHVASALPILANDCTDCHGHGGVLGTSASSDHVNGAKTIDGVKLTGVNLPDCTTICHDVNPARGDWADSAALGCVDCHSASYVGPIPTSGLHSANNVENHGIFTCGNCHSAGAGTSPSNLHLDGTTQNSVQASYSYTTWYVFSYDRNIGCAVVECHTDGGAWRRKWIDVVDAKPLTTDSPDAPVCGNCHGTFTTGWRTGVSARHSGSDVDGDIQANHRGDAANDCNLCHAWGNGNYASTMHKNAIIELNSNVGFEDISAVDGLVGCANCHASSDGTADEQHSFVDTEKGDSEGFQRWTRAFVAGPQGSCYSCHQSNGATHAGSNESLALHNSHNASSYIDLDGNFVAGDGSTFNNCDTCHGHNGSGGHVNGTVVFGNKINAPASYVLAGDTYAGSCTTTCHITEAGEWNTITGLSAGSTDACTSCHGSASVAFFQDQLPGLSLTWSASPAGPTTAKHAQHLGSSYAANCTNCHGANATTGDHATHKNKLIDNSISYVSITKTCANSCHIANTSGDWAVAGSLACDDCHGAANSANTLYRSRLSGSHSSHVATGSVPTTYGSSTNNSSGTTYDFGCGQCHPTSVASHLNGSTDELQIGISYNTPGAGQCSSNSCHQDGQEPSGPPAFVPTWGSAFVGDSCNKCHGNSPVSGAHSAHKVGIHADDTDNSDDGSNIQGIYDGTSGNLSTGGGLASSHGNASSSTTINCLTCHFSTVNVWYNALGSACSNCHIDSNNVSTGNEVMLVADTAKHVNGIVDVVFQGIAFRSKAQVREDLTSIPELNNNWTRTNGYKAVDGSSYDLAKTSLNADDYTDSTCTVSCHNSIAATWVTPTGNCSSCHTSLPQ